LIPLKLLKKSYDTTLFTLAGTKTSQESSLVKYNKDKTDNNNDQNKYKDAYDGALSKINGLVTTFKPECANMGEYMSTGVSNLVQEKKTETYLKNVKIALAVKP